MNFQIFFVDFGLITIKKIENVLQSILPIFLNVIKPKTSKKVQKFIKQNEQWNFLFKINSNKLETYFKYLIGIKAKKDKKNQKNFL